jgi:hypothetical protein
MERLRERVSLGSCKIPPVGALSILSKVQQSKEGVSSDLGGETAILNMKTGLYYCLDAVGARIWNLIERPKTVQEIRDTLLNEYEVEYARCENDLMAILQQLESEGLIEVAE